VKGTEFYVLMNQEGAMSVFCMKGLIEMISRLGRLDLSPGERGDLLRGRPPRKRRFRSDEAPSWGESDGDLKELRIEFENENGEKKILKIRFKE